MNRKNYLLAFILCVQTLFVSAQVYPVRAKLTDEKSFSMILLPDPQSYTTVSYTHLDVYKRQELY